MSSTSQQICITQELVGNASPGPTELKFALTETLSPLKFDRHYCKVPRTLTSPHYSQEMEEQHGWVSEARSPTSVIVKLVLIPQLRASWPSNLWAEVTSFHSKIPFVAYLQ